MKYLIDNNLPIKLAHALRELCSYDKSIEVYALSDKFKPSTKDIGWITELTKDSGWVVISQDRFKKVMQKKKHCVGVDLPFSFWQGSGHKSSTGIKHTTLFAGGHLSWSKQSG